jgi:hypothetical protein
MYATCLFCNKPLGRNEALETFPVGERLAFDAAKGRLWVVCSRCERWNLTPLEERWEAIEQAEKLYRDTRRRVTTDNIGLAKLPDGTTLVRVGEPLRPEFAAWRYGDQFGRRRQRQLLIAGGGVAAMGALVIGGAVAGVGIGGFGWLIARSASRIVRGNPETVVAKIRTESAGLVHVRRRHLAETTIARAEDGSLAIDLRFKNGQARFEGREAQRIASIVVPSVNRFGGNKRAVADAVKEIEAGGGPEAYLDRLAKVSHVYTRVRARAGRSRWNSWGTGGQSRSRWNSWGTDDSKYGLFGLPIEQRLALEMALHEEAERRALQGELEELERAWQDAEEVAAISDNLLVPEVVSSAIQKLKQKL